VDGFDRDPAVAEILGRTPTRVSIPVPLDPCALAAGVIVDELLSVIVVRLGLGSRRVWLARS
jgi:hypothetical protein